MKGRGGGGHAAAPGDASSEVSSLVRSVLQHKKFKQLTMYSLNSLEKVRGLMVVPATGHRVSCGNRVTCGRIQFYRFRGTSSLSRRLRVACRAQGCSKAVKNAQRQKATWVTCCGRVSCCSAVLDVILLFFPVFTTACVDVSVCFLRWVRNGVGTPATP